MPLEMPMISSLGSKQRPVVQALTQLNKKDVIADQEIAEGKNLSSDLFPIMTCRPPRELINTITLPNALFAANGKLCWVSGTNFVYDGVVKGAVTAGQKSMVDFNGKIIIMPDKKYYDYNTGTFGTIGGGAYPAAGSCPDMDFITAHMNRLFGVKGNDFYGSALGKYDDWTTFAGDNLDAYAVDIVDPGAFTAIVNFQQHINLWKPGYMYENYGSYPAQYQQQKICEIGCIDGRSVAEVNNRLYYLGPLGVYEYAGGLPRLISETLNETFKAGVAATDGRKYYISVQKQDNTWRLFVYDTWRSVWLPEDDLQVIDFATMGNVVYALAVDGKIYKFNSGIEVIDWEIHTKNFDDGLMGNKQVSGLRLQADLDTGSTISIYLSVNEQEFKLIKTIDKYKYNIHKATCKVERGLRYQFKMIVKGKASIYGYRREFVVGGDI